jgi:capsular polysaccharide biosynthesis protein
MQKNDFVEIDLREMLYLLLKRWYIIVMCFVLAAVTAFAVTQFYLKPIYRAETSLFLGQEKDKVNLSLSDLQVGSQLIIDYREILKSRLVAERIQQKLGVDVKRFQSNVDVQTLKDSRLFKSL